MDYRQARGGLLESRPVGPQLRSDLVELTDTWLQNLFQSAGVDQSSAALVTVGGYGRRQLSPGSDLDLVLLHESKADIAAAADRIWYPIWDSGVRLDHSVRTIAQARSLAAKDLRVVLGLLDLRVIAGNPELATKLRSQVLTDWRAMAAKRLPELRADVIARTSRSGELAYLLEPDLKESYGGLRDVTVLRAIAASWLCEADVDSIYHDVAVLLDARDALHIASGRNADRLLLQEQEGVAKVLGVGDANAMLRQVSAAGRAIAFRCEDAWFRVDRVTASKRRGAGIRRLRSGRPQRSPLAEGVVVQDGEAVLAVDADPSRDPVLVLRAAAAAAQAGLRLSPYTVSRLSAESAEMPTPWPVAARDALVSLLGAGRPALPVWESLDQSGVISRLIPEWEVVRSAPQRNPVHRFTVDRHLVETAVNAAGLTRQVSRPDLLLVGSLLHDIGKGRPGDHTEVGVELVREIAPRLGFNEADSHILVSLVAHHLLLPDTATRRDLADPVTAQTVADAVETTQVLTLLANLTEADALATGPAAWSAWKAGLVAELVARTRALLVGEAPPPMPELSERQRELATGEGVSVDIGPLHNGVVNVTVAAEDRVGLLAGVAGALAVNRMAVRAARTLTVADRAVTEWTVQPEFGEAPPVEILRQDISRSLAGQLDVVAKLAAREAAYNRGTRPAPPAPSITFVPAASERASVMEVRAHDVPGLLYLIATAIASVDVSIEAALVATLGSDAVDVFYLSSADEPLSDDESAAVRDVVVRALSS